MSIFLFVNYERKYDNWRFDGMMTVSVFRLRIYMQARSNLKMPTPFLICSMRHSPVQRMRRSRHKIYAGQKDALTSMRLFPNEGVKRQPISRSSARRRRCAFRIAGRWHVLFDRHNRFKRLPPVFAINMKIRIERQDRAIVV